jgi:hypothetical protein
MKRYAAEVVTSAAAHVAVSITEDVVTRVVFLRVKYIV